MGPVKLSEVEATVIKVNGDIIEVKPSDGQYFNLKELRDHIGCEFIEMVRLVERSNVFRDVVEGDEAEQEVMPLPTLDMIVDENGKLDNRPTNALATQVFKQYYPFSEDIIVGHVIIMKPKYQE